jgi:hypothetical protein
MQCKENGSHHIGKRSVVRVVCLEKGLFKSNMFQSQKEFDCTGTDCSRCAEAKVYLVVEDLSAKALQWI